MTKIERNNRRLYAALKKEEERRARIARSEALANSIKSGKEPEVTVSYNWKPQNEV